MGESTVYIRNGLGKTEVSASKPFCLPIFHSLQTFERKQTIRIKGSIELGLISKDQFFLDLNIDIKTITEMDKDKILKAFAQGNKRSEILTGLILNTLRENFKLMNFSEIASEKEKIESKINFNLKNQGVESSKITCFDVQRTALDDYDLENIIHFEAAKDIVTRIARVQIKDKEFIDKCRKAISHFDIVDE